MSLETDELRREKYFSRVERQYEKEIAVIFKDSLDEIRIEMAKIYDKYAVNGILTKAQMTQYNRLATLQKNIVAIMHPAARQATKIVDKMRPEEYGEAFWRTAWAVDNNTGVALSFGALNKEAVKKALDNPFFDSSIESFWFNVDNRVANAINNGLALGQSYPAMMRDLKDMVNRDNFEIMRVLRTELHNSQEAGTAQAYDDVLAQGIKGRVVWLSSSDSRTRDTHAQMDGVVRDETVDPPMFHGAVGDTPYPGWEGMEPGERITCRCDIRFELDDVDPVGGRVDPKESYEEWKEKYSTFK
jgi:uncharacterized protein with gpF-like domain